MSEKDLDWKPDESLPAGKGATKQRFEADDGKENLTIETHPWGDGELAADEQVVAEVEDEASDSAAFCRLNRVAEEYEEARDAFGQDASEEESSSVEKS
ncbi:MAG: hypothetical protein V3V75_00555 [Thermoguttaceae bacterium]